MCQTGQSFRESFGRKNGEYCSNTHEIHNEVVDLVGIGKCLDSSTPGSMRARAIIGGEELYHAWGDLLYSVQTGETAFENVFGMPFFQYLAQNDASATNFNKTMAGSALQAAAAFLAAYDFSWAKTIVDVGGGDGDGTLIASILSHVASSLTRQK